MATCEFCDTCLMFNEEFSDKTLINEILRGFYCNSNVTKCARHQMALSRGVGNVPPDLPLIVVRGQSTFGKYDF